MKCRLKEMGYPKEGIRCIGYGGEDNCEMPQEGFSAHLCGSCRNFDSKECVCKKDGSEKEPDIDFCDDIDYVEKLLDCEFGFRSPVRNEYSSDQAYEQACEAIKAINKAVKEEFEERFGY